MRSYHSFNSIYIVNDDQHNLLISICHLIIISLAFLTSFLNHLCITRYIEKTARQIYRIDFQPKLARNHHPDHSPNQNFAPSECTPARCLKALLQPQSPNCVVSVYLEPKVAILNCCDLRVHHWNIWKSYGNHAMISGNRNVSSPRFSK